MQGAKRIGSRTLWRCSKRLPSQKASGTTLVFLNGKSSKEMQNFEFLYHVPVWLVDFQAIWPENQQAKLGHGIKIQNFAFLQNSFHLEILTQSLMPFGLATFYYTSIMFCCQFVLHPTFADQYTRFISPYPICMYVTDK